MKSSIQLSVIVLSLLFANGLNAQIQWEGNGDGTSWQDGANWSSGTVPGATDIAEILIDATITGQIDTAPKRIKTGGGATIKFHLDMNLDNVAEGDNALVIGAKNIIEFGEEGTPYVFNFNTASNKHGILNNNSGDSSRIVVMKDASLNFNQHSNAMNLLAKQTVFENNGTINISSESKNGIKCGGMFTNNGSIAINETITDGIQVIGGVFTNEEEGNVIISKCGDDGLEVIDEGTLVNHGILTSTAVDDASSSNNALAVGSADTLGYFVNGFTGELNANGGASETARAISIYEEGNLTNAGAIITIGGNTATSIYNRNVLVNDKDGYIDLTDGRINANIGSLVNNGLIETTRDGSGIFSTENSTVTNNAFFRYENSGQFASGDGIIEDNGASLNNIYRLKIDAEGSCNVDIANTSYNWTINNNDYASSEDDGTLTFTPNSIQADSVILKTTLPEVNIKITNICQEAVMTTSVDDEEFASSVNMYPTLLRQGENLQVVTEEQSEMNLKVYDVSGRLLDQRNIVSNTSLSSANWGLGQRVVKLTQNNRTITNQILIIE